MRVERRAVAGLLGLLLCGGCLTGCGGNGGISSARSVAAPEAASSGLTVSDGEPVERELFAMDTYMNLRVWGDHAEEALDAAEREVKRLEQLLSVREEDSEIYRANAGETVELSEDTAALMEEAIQLSEETDGAFDVTIYPLMEAWGFPSGNYNVLSESEREELLTGVGMDHVHYDAESRTLSLDEGTRIDLGGIAKGYLADCLAGLMRIQQVPAAMLSLGSSTIQLTGAKPDGALWSIALRDPEDENAFAGILKTEACVIDTSGGYERFFEEDGKIYWHILDPSTGAPAESGLTSVTVVGTDGVEGDGLATALFVMGEEKALDYWRTRSDEFDLVLVREDGKITVTEGIQDAFTTEHETITAEKEA